jgi:hypothetical protein
MTTARASKLLLALALTVTVAACERSQAAASRPAQELTRIVFVGKKDACDCTRKTVDTGWATLQNALGTPATRPVERLQIDTEAEKVEPYRKQKPFMALPAIYFLDGKNTEMELLQGEVSEAQSLG